MDIPEALSEAILPGCGEAEPSPDLANLACVQGAPQSEEAGIWIVPADGGEPRPIVTCRDVERVLGTQQRSVLSRPRWAPDGRWIAFATHEGMPPGRGHRLWVVGVETDEACGVLYESPGVIAGHRWSPDGEHVALADSIAGLVVIQRDGGLQVAADRAAMRYPLADNGMAWSEDGLSLLYVSLPSHERGLWRMVVRSGGRERVLALQEDEVAVPGQRAGRTWGALVGNHRKPGGGLRLQVCQELGEEPMVCALPDVEFDAASELLSTADGVAWGFSVRREGRRVPCALCLPGGEVWEPSFDGCLERVICWLEQPRRLLVLLSPLRFVALEPSWERCASRVARTLPGGGR